MPGWWPDGGHAAEGTAREEHERDARSKRVLLIGFDGSSFPMVRTDALGNLSIGAGGATQYPWGGGATLGAIGTLLLGYRNDGLLSTISAANGQLAAFSVDSVGRLRVNPSYSVAESQPHSIGGSLLNLISGVRHNAETAISDLEEDFSVFLTDDVGRSKTNCTGNVDHDAADLGRPIKIGGRARTAVPAGVQNNDRVDAYFDEEGYQHIRIDNANVQVKGNVDHDAVDVGEPVKIGGKALSALPTSVAAADRTNGCFDVWGRLITENASPGDSVIQVNTLTTTSDVGLVAPVAGFLTVVKSLLCGNAGTTLVRLDLKEGSTTKVSMPLAASGGGFDHLYGKGWALPSGATLTGALSASGDVRVNMEYYRRAY